MAKVTKGKNLNSAQVESLKPFIKSKIVLTKKNLISNENKFYIINSIFYGGKWMVTCHYGRIGTKGAHRLIRDNIEPSSYSVSKIPDDLYKAKLAKGYGLDKSFDPDFSKALKSTKKSKKTQKPALKLVKTSKVNDVALNFVIPVEKPKKKSRLSFI